jgi:hypothetical protein
VERRGICQELVIKKCHGLARGYLLVAGSEDPGPCARNCRRDLHPVDPPYCPHRAKTYREVLLPCSCRPPFLAPDGDLYHPLDSIRTFLN